METNAARINVEWFFALIWCANRRNLDESKFQMVQLGTQWGETISVKTSHITHIQHDWDFEVWQCSHSVYTSSSSSVTKRTYTHTITITHMYARICTHSLTRSLNIRFRLLFACVVSALADEWRNEFPSKCKQFRAKNEFMICRCHSNGECVTQNRSINC